MSSSKKAKLDGIEAVCAAIRDIQVEGQAQEDWETMARNFMKDIGPGRGLRESRIPEIQEEELEKAESASGESPAQDETAPAEDTNADKTDSNSRDDQAAIVPEAHDATDEHSTGAAAMTPEVIDDVARTPADRDEGDSQDIDYEDESGGDYVQLSDGTAIHRSSYYGRDWGQRIVDLHKVEPLPTPEKMTLTPHDYQLKGAAQLLWLAQGPWKGALLGDPPGLGKTLQATLAMHALKGQGRFLVLCPASLGAQWVREIEGYFVEGHGLKAIHLDDPTISAHKLQAEDIDVIVCSYEFAAANATNLKRYATNLEEYENLSASDKKLAIKPRKPTCALATELRLHTLFGPFLLGFQDEAQNINKRGGQRHQAALALCVQAWVMMSGTLAHNKWYDLSGYFDFLKSHPFTTNEEFMRQFSAATYTSSSVRQPTGPQIKLLQRVLQAALVMRPASTLQLPPCNRLAFELILPSSQAEGVTFLTEKYLSAVRIDGPNVNGGSEDDMCSLGSAVRAQLFSLHPRLVPQKLDEEWDPGMEDLSGTTMTKINEKYGDKVATSAAEKRRQWEEELARWTDEELLEPVHPQALVELIAGLVHGYRERVVVFSQYLRYLDIIALGLLRQHNINTLRFDGTVAKIQRSKIERNFAQADNRSPLLITAGAGGVGLNLTQGTIMIQTEQWWNSNTVGQAICRLHRQGQTKKVMVIKFHVSNSAIDQEISKARRLKSAMNEKLMKPLYHSHEGAPEIVDLIQ